MTSRRVGRCLAAGAGAASLLLAIFVAHSQSIPALGVYDGGWMLLWGTIAVVTVAPVVWRWRRERSVAAVAIAALVGCWMPIVISALRHQIPIMARLKGSWILAGAGVVGVAVPLGFVCLWLAIREHR
ncbi:MAG TPA: hypothetical protein VIG08_13390 [Gemmatimonadales bacterium]